VRTQLEFNSDAFPALPGEDEQINPGRWGKRLADYLRAELSARGLPGGEPYAEDWGWEIPIDNAEFGIFVGCGNIDGEEKSFLCFIDPSKPTIRKLFRKIDTRERIEQVATALYEALSAHPKVTDLRWTSEVQGGA
jgi:hypothetical protein